MHNLKNSKINTQNSNNVQFSNETKNQRKFDLDDRTLQFSKNLIAFLKTTEKNTLTLPIISQLIRSGTSIGANCCEAIEAGSKKDFINKIVIAKKEARETRYWLKLLLDLLPNKSERIEILYNEARELNLILSAIVRNSRP